MRKKDVPQDESKLSLNGINELCYAVDEKGNYTTTQSKGWEPKILALNKAIENIDERIMIAKERVLNNTTSPIEYYMEMHRMDLPILASYAGVWKWRIKRHFKPAIFKKLSTKTLHKYATVFNISLAQLQNIDSKE